MPKVLDAIVRDFLADLERPECGAVRAVALYGSAATPVYIPGRSDLNLLVVADPITLDLLKALQARMGTWARDRIATPLLVDPAFLGRSTDSYPLEILGMLAAYRVLKGSDPLAGLKPAAEHVRVQVEREAKGKQLLLRRGFVESGGRRQGMAGYLAGALPAIDAILRGMLYLAEADWKLHGPALRVKAAMAFGLDGATLEGLREARYGKRPDRAAALVLYERTLALIETIANWADRPAHGA
jgi:hypothetical protein